MEILDDALHGYLSGLLPVPDPIVAEMEAHGLRDGVPIVPPETRHLLGILTRACGARRVIEVGTAIGVSTLAIARALPADGELVTFDVDPARQASARGYLERAGVAGLVDLRLQPALEGLKGLAGPYDMAFLDAVKSEYPGYLQLVLPLLRPGGLLVIDNALMRRAALGATDHGFDAAGVAAMGAINASLRSRTDIVGTVVPVGDGMVIAVRSSD
jgi:predicted O-methyltransferase YrrM